MSWDRRLPFGAATVVGAAAFAVAVSGGAAAVLKDSPAATVAQAPAPAPAPSKSAAPKPKPKPKPTKPAKPDDPSDYLLDVEKAVPGWTRMSDRLAGAGPMDLNDAAEIEAGGEKPTEKDRQVLRDAGFVRGHSRAWRNDDGVMLVVFAYEWKNAQGPEIMLVGMRHVNEQSAGWQPAVPNSYGVCRLQNGQIYDATITAIGKHSFLTITLRKDGNCTRHEPVAKITELMERHAKKLGA